MVLTLNIQAILDRPAIDEIDVNDLLLAWDDSDNLVAKRVSTAQLISKIISELTSMGLFDDTPVTFAASNQATSTTDLTSIVSSILAVNSDRKGIKISNKGANIAYIGFSNAITSTNCYQAIAGLQSYEFPVAYTGQIWGICAATKNTTISITEFTS